MDNNQKLLYLINCYKNNEIPDSKLKFESVNALTAYLKSQNTDIKTIYFEYAKKENLLLYFSCVVCDGFLEKEKFFLLLKKIKQQKFSDIEIFNNLKNLFCSGECYNIFHNNKESDKPSEIKQINSFSENFDILLECPICFYKNDSRNIWKHLNFKHGITQKEYVKKALEKYPFKCEFCDNSIFEDDKYFSLDKIKRRNSKIGYKCKTCTDNIIKGFVNWPIEKLNFSLSSKKGKELLYQHKCPICFKEAKNIRSVIHHFANTHYPNFFEFYNKYLRDETEGHCKQCNKKILTLPTHNTKHKKVEYTNFCSLKCSNNNPEVTFKKLSSYFTKNSSIESEELLQKYEETNDKQYLIDLMLLLRTCHGSTYIKDINTKFGDMTIRSRSEENFLNIVQETDKIKGLYSERDIHNVLGIENFYYSYNNKRHLYIPDFLLELDSGQMFLFEIKSWFTFSKSAEQTIVKWKELIKNINIPFYLCYDDKIIKAKEFIEYYDRTRNPKFE